MGSSGQEGLVFARDVSDCLHDSSVEAILYVGELHIHSASLATSDSTYHGIPALISDLFQLDSWTSAPSVPNFDSMLHKGMFVGLAA